MYYLLVYANQPSSAPLHIYAHSVF